MDIADLLDQLDGRTAERIDRPFDLREAEARRWHGGADVGRQHQLEAAANTVAVHRGDYRFRIGLVFQQCMVDHSRDLGSCRQVAADIGTDGKGALADTGQYDAATRVTLQFVPEPAEFAQHLSRHGIEARLIVDADNGNMPAMSGETNLPDSGS